MKITRLMFYSCLLITPAVFSQNIYHNDFIQFWNTVNNNDAYLEARKIDWKNVKNIYEPKSKKVNNHYEFIEFLEEVFNEFHNGHASLNTNLDSSNRLIPSGQDIFVEKINGEFIITDIRKDSGAYKSGLKTGMKITLFNGKQIQEQIAVFLPKYTSVHTREMKQYAINMLFAGKHNSKRVITVLENCLAMKYYPDNFQIGFTEALLENKTINNNTAYIKFNNSLNNYQLITEFDSILNNYLNSPNLILDLSETPSGGNTTVARAIMGRFIEDTLPYQKHEIDEKQFKTKRIWKEYVSPRKATYKGNLYIIVGRWTGSMGEGIAIGFDGLNRATIIGTPMAGLLGAVSNFCLPESGICFQIPTERLYHVNGIPREKFLPHILTQNHFETFDIIYKIK